jgi:hypothetical protein
MILLRVGQASAVRASGPTARPAHASPHLINADLDAALPGGFLLCRSDPADPLVSRQRSDIGPEALRSGVAFDGLPEVCRQLMNRAVSHFLSRHPSRVFVPPNDTAEARAAPSSKQAIAPGTKLRRSCPLPPAGCRPISCATISEPQSSTDPRNTMPGLATSRNREEHR